MNAKEIQAQIDEDGGELAPLDALVPWDRNPRINDIAAKQLAAFVADKGWGAPILVQRGTNRIIGGHTRWKAAKKLGLKRVPVRYRTCDDRTADALAMADNKLGEVAEWNAPGVAEVLSGFGLEEAEAIGWDSHDLEQLAKGVADFGPLEPATIVEDEVPEPPKVAVTKPGDVWRMGGHTLVCGDCRAQAFKADLLVTDPPYEISYEGRLHKVRDPIANDTTTEVGVAGMMHAVDWLPPGGPVYVFGPSGPDGLDFANALRKADILRQRMVWAKHHFSIGRSDYHYQHEDIYYGWKPGASHAWHGDRSQTSVWNYNKPHASEEHPTMKPVEMIAYAIGNSSRPGQTVADPFLGSGTTLVAAEQTGRICVGTEIDPRYCDVIVERWQALTGGKAERVSG